MAGSRILDSPDDDQLVKRLIAVAEAEGFIYHVPGANLLKQAVSRTVPLDRFDRDDLDRVFHELWRLAVARVGMEHIFGSGAVKEVMTIPPPSASAASGSKHDIVPSPSAADILPKLRSLGVRVTRLQRLVAALTKEVSDLEFIYGHLQLIFSSLESIKAKTEISGYSGEDLGVVAGFLDRATKDISKVEMITQLDEETDLRKAADELAEIVAMAQLESKGTQRDRLTALSRQVSAARGAEGLFSVRAQMLEAYLRAQLIIEPYPSLTRVEQEAIPREEMATISLEDNPQGRARDVADPAISDKIHEEAALAQAMLRFLKDNHVRLHVTRRIEQLERIETNHLTHPRTPFTLIAIREDLDMLGRLVDARIDGDVEKLADSVLIEISVGIGLRARVEIEAARLEQLRQKIEDDAAAIADDRERFNDLKSNLLRAHTFAVSRITPYDLPLESSGGSDGGGPSDGSSGPASKSGSDTGSSALSASASDVPVSIKEIDAPFDDGADAALFLHSAQLFFAIPVPA